MFQKSLCLTGLQEWFPIPGGGGPVGLGTVSGGKIPSKPTLIYTQLSLNKGSLFQPSTHTIYTRRRVTSPAFARLREKKTQRNSISTKRKQLANPHYRIHGIGIYLPIHGVLDFHAKCRQIYHRWIRNGNPHERLLFLAFLP